MPTERGRQPEEGTTTYCLAKFAENCMNMKKIRPGGASKILLCRSATGWGIKLFTRLHYWQSAVADPGFPEGSLVITIISGGSKISPRRGRQLPGGANIRFCQIFPKLHEIERIWAPRGACIPHAPLRSATDYSAIFSKKCVTGSYYHSEQHVQQPSYHTGK